MDFGDKLVYKVTNKILIPKEYILVYLFIQVALYILLVIRFRRSEKSE